MMMLRIAGALIAAWGLDAAAGPLRGACPDWTPAERTIQAACDSNSDCSRIADQYASCPKVRAWFNAVAPSDGKTITAGDVGRALALARSPDLVESESSVRARDCLGVTYSWKECRVYLGLAYNPPENRVANIDPALPSERAAVTKLLDFMLPTVSDRRAAGRGEAYDALAACEGARDNPPQRAEICGKAQDAYDRCRKGQDDWDSRRHALLAQLDGRRPDLGRSCHIPDRDMDPANTGSSLTNQWNCAVNALRTLKLPGCPGFLPSSWQTPMEALAAWDQEDRAKGRSGAGGQDVATARAGAGFAANLFQQSAAQAGRDANDPQAAARVAADKRAREAEMSGLIAAGERRQQAIMSLMTGQVMQSMQAAASGQAPTTAGGALGSTYTLLQQSAAAGGGTLAQMPTMDQLRGGSPGALAGGAGTTPGTATADMPGSSMSPADQASGQDTGSAASGAGCNEGPLAAEINAINARARPNASTVESTQTAMYVAQRAINFYSSAQCAGDPRSSGLLAQMRRAYESAKSNCLAVAASANLCAPKLN